MQESNNNSTLIIVVFLLIVLIVLIATLPKTLVFFSKANSSSTSSIAFDNSYLFASPIQAKADSQEKVRVSVFILDGRGLGVSNKTITLDTPQVINNIHVQAITDESGKAMFDLSSSTPGTYSISAQANGKDIPQKLKIVFY